MGQNKLELVLVTVPGGASFHEWKVVHNVYRPYTIGTCYLKQNKQLLSTIMAESVGRIDGNLYT